MTRDEIDTLWHKAMHDAIKDGEDFTRHHFAALIAAAEREACAALCDAEHKWLAKIADRDGAGAAAQCAYKIRAQTILVVPTK